MKRRDIYLRIAVSSIVILFSLSNASGKTWYVRKDGSGDTKWLSLAIVSAQPPEETVISNEPDPIGCMPCGSMAFSVRDFSGPFTIKGFTMRDHRYGELMMLPFTVEVVNASGVISDNILTENQCCEVVIIGDFSSVVLENNIFYNNVTGTARAQRGSRANRPPTTSPSNATTSGTAREATTAAHFPIKPA
jgi:hypothetical protein